MKTPNDPWRRFFLSLLLFAVMVPICMAADAATPAPGEQQRPRMEIFGIGPELFQDRGIAWAKAVGAVLGEAVSQFGILAAAIVLLKQNLNARKHIKDVKEEVVNRLDRQGDRIEANRVAIAKTAAAAQVPVPPEVVAPTPTPVPTPPGF